MNCKKALLIGINYINSQYELRGCVNDITRFNNILINKYKWNKKNITILSEISKIIPTKINIENELKKLLYLKNTDIIIYFSGHGTQAVDKSGDEIDKKDECWVPLDFELKGVITDDYIFEILSKLDKTNNILLVSDSCHSGSICDLKYNCDKNKNIIIENRRDIKANVICYSGCQDNSTSADAYIENQNTGAFSYCLCKCDFKKTFIEVSREVNELLKKNKFNQVSVLSTSSIENINKKFESILI